MNIEEEIIKQCKDIIFAINVQGYLNDEERSSTVYLYGLLDLYEKEKEKNKKYEKLICRIRNLSSGVVGYDIINGKKYLGPRKNFSKQKLYEQFFNIKLLLKGNYIFLSNEEFLELLLKEE